MNEKPQDPSFNENFLLLTKDKDKDKIMNLFTNVLQANKMEEITPPLLKEGIKISILKSILTLLDLGINPLRKEILPEYKVLTQEVREAYEKIHPDYGSSWIEECMQYGDKKAYHWDWKHFGSKELF